ncbi:MAG: bifunctional histidinal dehydrogenase/ histidinol dehydrogenase [Methanomassiliicoccales archaeon PtaB.Bin215]|nr:MAG: bifunctional histidinal dehydrogenase/ histidinol dehydrogenase [Methanomassiliicoccales archaeon PtaB.Bin215]
MWQALSVESWKARGRSDLSKVVPTVSDIIDQVRKEGDRAVLRLTAKFDKVELSDLKVSREEIEEAYSKIDAELLDALKFARSRIESYHRRQRPDDVTLFRDGKSSLGWKYSPLASVGIYIPGGKASYPSTALMCAVPAKVAGVRSVIACTPPPVHPLTLVALDMSGVDTVFKCGGAQAIAAMGLGTQTVPKVLKIVGPGNLYVTAAKVLLRQEAEMDFPAGPSEIAVLADGTARPENVAADILAQAEHGPDSACALVTDDAELIEKVGRIIEKSIQKSERQELILSSLKSSGHILVQDMEEGVAVCNQLAPEHLSIQTKDPLSILPSIETAGAIFLGDHSPVACGDYTTGTDHVLPTAGNAAVHSGLDVLHFMKRSSVQMLDPETLEMLAPATLKLAETEGLRAHAESVRVRLKK